MSHAEQFDPLADLDAEQAAAVAVAMAALAVCTSVLYDAVPFPMTYETLQARVKLDEAFMWLNRGMESAESPSENASPEQVQQRVRELLATAFAKVAQQNTRDES